MTLALGIMIGLAVAATIAVPVGRALLRRETARVRDAERRAREAERLAELGSMTGGLAHEIKNPLSTVLLNGQLLAEGLEDAGLAEEERSRLLKRLGALQREVERLRAILEDFLRFAGRIKLDPHPVDLAAMVEELADFFLPQCTQAGVTLRTQVPGEPIVATVDASLLKQALLNLMINAVQAMQTAAVTPAGGAGAEPPRCELMLRVDRDDDGARLQVIDTGPGMNAQRLGEIFHPYVSHKAGGTGLGLPVSRRIIEEHGGRLEAFSEEGRGSDFVITLPTSV